MMENEPIFARRLLRSLTTLSAKQEYERQYGTGSFAALVEAVRREGVEPEGSISKAGYDAMDAGEQAAFVRGGGFIFEDEVPA